MERDPQVLHRRMIVDIEHPQWGPVRQFGTAIKLSESRAEPRAAAPAPGEHTDEVLRQLGLAQTEIDRLRLAGVPFLEGLNIAGFGYQGKQR